MKLTKEQCEYYILIKRMNELMCVDEENRDTYQINEIKTILWERIKKFAKAEMFRMINNIEVDLGDLADIEQELAMVFFEKLPEYDPLKSTPTTYYVRHFRHVISTYIRKYKSKLTQYDANNARKVRYYINEYEKRGISWTIEMIAEKSGLSPKVVKSTIYYSSNARTANVEEAYQLESSLPTPEKSFEEKENDRILAERLLENTTEEELQLIILRTNDNGHKEMLYEKIAEKTGKSVREVKSILNRAICKLNQDKILRNQFGHENRYHCIERLKIQEPTTDLMQEQMEEHFGSL